MITGGNFGLEASYITILITFSIGLYLLKIVSDNKLIIRPRWKRNENLVNKEMR